MSYGKKITENHEPEPKRTGVMVKRVETWLRLGAHHLPAAVPLSFPSSAAVVPQELLGIVDGLGDHVAVSQEA